jgi:hypothetical protein
MGEATELGYYLPLSFKSPKEQEYIEFLWDAFETNYTHSKYQFAFLAYHMLTMSFVYFNIWQIKQTEPKDFAEYWGQREINWFVPVRREKIASLINQLQNQLIASPRPER